MLKIGLTGGIGSGKTTVARIFGLLGTPVYYADLASKRLYSTNKALRESIIKIFGAEIYSGNSINRKLLASIVFNDPEKLNLLNSLVHPLTIQDADNWMARQTAPYIIKEAALLFESGADKSLDYVIGVHTPLPLRMKRVMERDHISQDEVLKRMNNQLDESVKMKLCNYIINNNENELVILQVLHLHQLFSNPALPKLS